MVRIIKNPTTISTLPRYINYTRKDNEAHYRKAIIISPASAPAAPSALLTGLVSYYKLDESSGNALDSHGNHDGTVNGATQGASGKIGTAYSFDGIDDYVAVTNDGTFTFGNGTTDSAFTISVWINMVDATKFRIISAYIDNNPADAEWTFTVDGVDKLRMVFFDLNTSGANRKDIQADNAITVDQGTWINVAITHDGSTPDATNVILYRNGAAINRTLITNGSSYIAKGDYNSEVNIGTEGRNFTDPDFADGLIDEIGIWSRVLTTDEISELYNSGSGLTYPF